MLEGGEGKLRQAETHISKAEQWQRPKHKGSLKQVREMKLHSKDGKKPRKTLMHSGFRTTLVFQLQERKGNGQKPEIWRHVHRLHTVWKSEKCKNAHPCESMETGNINQRALCGGICQSQSQWKFKHFCSNSPTSFTAVWQINLHTWEEKYSEVLKANPN